MKESIKKYIEAELRDYHQTKKEYDEMRCDILNESPAPPDGMPRGGETSDPTFKRAQKLQTNRRLRYMEKVVHGIGIVINELDSEKTALIELKYWQRPRQLTDAGIAAKLNIDKRTLYRWTDIICRLIGIELGVLSEIECHKDVTFGT